MLKSQASKMKCISLNSTCKQFHFGESCTSNTAISCCADMVCPHMATENWPYVDQIGFKHRFLFCHVTAEREKLWFTSKDNYNIIFVMR